MLPENDDDEVTETEEETWITEIVEHPTRDDWHEQRQRGQTREAVLHARSTILTIQLARTSKSTG